MDLSVQRSELQRNSSLTSGFAFLEKHLRRISFKTQSSESTQDVWGPRGLNLLSSSTEPLIDLIFVHGLRGGSRKTWSYSDDLIHFWPQEWLSRDTDFKNVQIYSFGYNADWAGQKEDILNIHDFGKTLLGDMDNSPHIRQGQHVEQRPIILVGHSMGGLVIKKAYLLAKQDPQYDSLAARICSMFFLATPHRGAGSAPLLNNLLKISILHSTKAYVTDLEPRSITLQVINDEFRLLSQGLRLWSFYETLKTTIGGSSKMIVERDSAIIGLPEEKTQPLNANHRQICKFETPMDAEYITLRNALATTISSVLEEQSGVQIDKHRRDMQALGNFLDVYGRPEDDLTPEEDRVQGSCEWLTEKPSFNEWMEETQQSPKFFWINGNPGSGKSVLTSYTVNFLEKSNKDCCYFFFRHNDKSRSSISAMLRSLAYQMALTNVKIREALSILCKEGNLKFDQIDERVIWRKLFLGTVFQETLQRPHFWVIDALDECNNLTGLGQILTKIDPHFPLRIFMSSRYSPDLDRIFHPIGSILTSEIMSLDHIQSDIKLYINANMHMLPVEDYSTCKDLTDKILQKSNDCFLWAHLVLMELEQTYSEEQIMEVLDEVPKEMDQLYTRILDGMSHNTRNKRIIKAIITWTVCATQPLDIDEFREALRIDIDTSIPRLDKLIKSICGEMIHVDKQSKVQMVHQTARDFILGSSINSEFAVEQNSGHTQLAVACLRYLVSKEMTMARRRRKNSAPRVSKKSCFIDYASISFSEHVKRCNTSEDLPLILLDEFFKANVLSWIEHLAQKGALIYLVRTSENLKVYLQRREEQRSLFKNEFQRLEGWATDLVRIAVTFADNLSDFPFAVHFLLPTVCPPQSKIYQQFANDPRIMEVIGAISSEWDDRLTSIAHHDDYCTAISCHDSHLAVGLSRGQIMIYNAATCHELLRLTHGERVNFLEFGDLNPLLASSGRKIVRLWNHMTGHQLWTANVEHQLLGLFFRESEQILLAATRGNQIASWSVDEGRAMAASPWHCTSRSQIREAEGSLMEYPRMPTIACFSEGLDILAIAYRSKPLVIWDLEEDTFIGTFDRRASPRSEDTALCFGTYVPSAMAVSLAFNPDPNLRLLAVSYQDGDLLVIDPIEQELKTPIVVADVSVITASPNGKLLIGGDAGGTIKIFNFEALELLHQIYCVGYDIRGLVFRSDGLRFFDIRGPQCNVWEPPVLRKIVDDGTGYSEETPLRQTLTNETQIWNDEVRITAMVAHHTGDYIFCAKEDGSVWVCMVDTGIMLQELYRHAACVKNASLIWNQKENLLASADLSSRVLVYNIVLTPGGQWIVQGPLLDQRSDHSIRQILLNPLGDCLLVSTTSEDITWDMEGNQLQLKGHHGRESWTWTSQSQKPDQLLLVTTNRLHIYNWNYLEMLTDIDGNTLEVSIVSDTVLCKALIADRPQILILEHVKVDRNSTNRQVSLFNMSEISATVDTIRPNFQYLKVTSDMTSIIALHGSLLVFVNHSNWICSVDLRDLDDNAYTQHFFIPPGWYNPDQFVSLVTTKGDIAIVQEDGIILVKGGLYFENVVRLDLEKG